MHSFLRLVLPAALLLVSAYGCDEPKPPEGPSLTIGIDDGGFVAIADDETLLLEPGMQGGYHVDFSIRADEIEAEGALLELDGTDADTGEILFVSVIRQLTSSEVDSYDDHWIRFDERLVWIDTDPTSGVGRRIRIDARLTEAASAIETRSSVEVAIGYPTLTIGVDEGGASFAASMEGDDVEIVAGIQGLYHLEVALRAEHVEVDGAILSIQGIDADTGEVLTIVVIRLLSPARVTEDATGWTRFGELAILIAPDPTDDIGRRIRVEATVTDPLNGRVAADMVTMNIVDDFPGF